MDEILKKSLITLALGILSWVIKDLLFKSLEKRKEASRTEWKYRLTQIWSPVYYWSGTLTMSDSSNEGWNKHGIKELESALSESAHLLPLVHYRTLVRMIEGATKQSTTKIALEEVMKTRDYIYRQIQLLNYLLYRHEAFYQPDVSVDPTWLYKSILRSMSGLFIHVLVWAFIAAIIAIPVIFYSRGLLCPLILFVGTLVSLFLVAVISDFKKRREIYKEIKKLSKE